MQVLLSVEEASQVTGCSVGRIRAWADAGLVDCYVVKGKRWRALGARAIEQIRGIQSRSRAVPKPRRTRVKVSAPPAAV